MMMRGTIQAVRVSTRNQVFLDVRTYANSIHKNVPLFGQFGMASVPKAGTRCILIPLNNDDEALIAISVQSLTTDMGLSEGQTAIGTNEATLKITDGIEAATAFFRGQFGTVAMEAEGFTLESNGMELMEVLIETLQNIGAAATLGAVNNAAAIGTGKLSTIKG